MKTHQIYVEMGFFAFHLHAHLYAKIRENEQFYMKKYAVLQKRVNPAVWWLKVFPKGRVYIRFHQFFR